MLDLASSEAIPVPVTKSKSAAFNDDDVDVSGTNKKNSDDKSITSDVSDLDQSVQFRLKVPATKSTTKYISKPRCNAMAVKGAVLQPYANARIGFIPSVGYCEKKLTDSKNRVIVKKMKDVIHSASTPALQKAAVTTLGLVGDKDSLKIEKSESIKDYDRYFSWNSESLFVFRVCAFDLFVHIFPQLKLIKINICML
jgi:hypothetical protein